MVVIELMVVCWKYPNCRWLVVGIWAIDDFRMGVIAADGLVVMVAGC